MKGYYINLDHRLDRLANMKEQQKKLNIKLKRVPGIYTGLEGVNTVYKSIFEKNANEECILICEDDLQIINKLNIDINELPADWDVIVYGSYYYIFEEPRYTKHIYDYNDIERPLKEYEKLKEFSSTHCVLYRNTIYNEIKNFELKKHFDVQLSELCSKYNIYLKVPMPARQLSDYSDLIQKETNYNTFTDCHFEKKCD